MNKLYQEITDRVIALMEQGTIPWHKPWAGTKAGAISHTTGKPYSLLNQCLLQVPGEYATFLQIKAEGGRVKKGAKAKTIYFWKLYKKPMVDDQNNPVLDDEGKQKQQTIPVLKSYLVFHVIDDCEGIENKYASQMPEIPAAPVEEVEAALMGYIDREKITLKRNLISDSAYYSPRFDKIVLPRIDQFESTAEYYSTAFHESVHSTGHKKRLARFTGEAYNAAFGSEEYSKEELVAEIGAACICHRFGIATESSIKNSAAYLQNWLSALKDDKQMIVGAMSRAEKAIEYILD
jgi:antirestriction protein ArdC